MGARTEPRYEQGSYLHDLRLKWATLYEARLNLLGATTTIIPLGDPAYGAINSTTGCTTVLGASGLATTFAYIAAPSAYTTPFKIPEGITGAVPEFVMVPSASEYLRAADDAYWTRALVACSWSVWANVTNTAGVRAILSKTDSTTLREWEIYVDASDFLTVKLWDETANVSVKRVTDAAIPMGRPIKIDVTYSGVGAGANGADGIAIYIDGAVVASTATGDVNWISMQDTTSRVYVGLAQASATDEYTGSIFGGPLGPAFVQTELAAGIITRDTRLTLPFVRSGI